MDLRVQKTHEAIREQFLYLRATAPLTKIRVSAICERAKINKTTFYRRYLDVYDLSDQIEGQVLAELMSDWDGSLCLFTDPNRFIDGLFRALRKRERVINILFRDRMEALISKFEDALLALYLRESDSARDAIRLSFVVGGASRVFLNGKYDYNTDSKVLADILTRISARTTA